MSRVDFLVGQRIKARRQSLNLTQKNLADGIGVSFQQLQKYETGLNRVSASRLWQIAEALDVQISHFFSGIEAGETNTQTDGNAFLSDRDSVELMDLFSRLPDAQRHAVLSFMRSLAESTRPMVDQT